MKATGHVELADRYISRSPVHQISQKLAESRLTAPSRLTSYAVGAFTTGGAFAMVLKSATNVRSPLTIGLTGGAGVGALAFVLGGSIEDALMLGALGLIGAVAGSLVPVV
ncbi:MAG: hypothetical protein A2Y36_00845 [Treponema sp. GWA1_62_8]|nr:MAG: hypothetical protein A2Y36_00845 [Treponema sp. GWA1_62_8]